MRLYKLRILNPLLDVNEIQKRYDIISLLINDNLYINDEMESIKSSSKSNINTNTYGYRY